MGSGGDSFYEYLLKQRLLKPNSKRHMLAQYIDAVDSALSRVATTQGGMVSYVHLSVCYLCVMAE